MADGRYALIVASSRYSDATLTQLEAPVHDARSLATVLSTPAIGDFDVTTLADEPASKVMQEIEAFFDGRRREDLVLLYFSGHGILDESARLYFATTDTRVDRPRSTAVSANFVNDLMSECRSRRQVLMLDCCNSGAFARGIKAGGTVGTGERFEGRGRVVITASDALQYAFEAGRVEGEGINSVFTRALVDGLETGDADLNGDGRVTLDELYDYVYGRVLDASPRQRPHKWAFGVEGQIFIARTTAPAAQPTPPPERPPAETAPAAHAPKTARPRKPLLRRPLVWAGAAIVAAGAAAVTAALAFTGPDEPPSLAAGRNTALSVFESWQNEQLWKVDDRLISASARRALNAMPIEPVTPTPPAPDACHGDADDVTCSFTYPGLDLYLSFNVLQYSTGLRLADVRCYSNNTYELVPGGIAACARIVRNS
jgi:Caspase domain